MFVCGEEDGWIMGRGTRDCLGNCAVIVHVLAAAAGRADIGGGHDDLWAIAPDAFTSNRYGADGQELQIDERMVMVSRSDRYVTVAALPEETGLIIQGRRLSRHMKWSTLSALQRTERLL